MKILVLGHSALRERAEPVKNIDGELKEIIDKAAEIMYKAKGIGLAANQIGILKRFFLMDVSQREGKRKLEVFINPEIISAEGETIFEEGCLSIPGYYAPVKRYAKLYIKAYDIEGNLFEKELEELPAIVFQHEYDHLDGILFIDRLSPLKKQIFKRWWKKHSKEMLNQSA